MSAITWAETAPRIPAELSGCILQEGFQYGPIDTVINFPCGFALGKKRPRFTEPPYEMIGKIVVNVHRKMLLDEFTENTIRHGALSFTMADPLNPYHEWHWKLVEPLDYEPYGAMTWVTTLKLVRVPGTLVDVGTGKVLVDAADKVLTDDFGEWLEDA